MNEKRRARRFWVFDRPVWHDSLFWTSIGLGVLLAAWTLSGESSGSTVEDVGDAFVGFASGWFIIAVIGSTLRGLLRGYRDT